MPADSASMALPDITKFDPSSPMPAAAETGAPKIEGYQVLEPLGCGGMGTVWLALQLGTRRKVALKLMSAAVFTSEQARIRFDREVELTARLAHPNIAQVFDSGIDRGIYFYAMECIDGLPLDLYAETQKLPRREILQLMLIVCRAIRHAHQRGVIHRDLKPGNILVDAEGQPHVVDFGLAQTILREPGRADGLNGGAAKEGATGQALIDTDVAGTPAFMSPEQASGKFDRLDTRADVFSLGVILYRLLLKQPPHDLYGSAADILRRVAENEPLPPREVDPTIDRDLQALLLRALAHDPDDRYASAHELARDLDNYLNGDALIARPLTFLQVLRKQLAKHIWLVSGGVAAVVLLIGMGVYSYIRVSEAGRLAEQQKLDAQSLIRFDNSLARQATASDMLNMIVAGTMACCRADAATLFRREGDQLHFEVARNLTLEAKQGRPATAAQLGQRTIPVSAQSIAGYVALSGTLLNLPDAYQLSSGVPYRFDPELDQRTGYHTQSMLVVPLTDPDNRVLAVLELINCRGDDGQIVPFPDNKQEMIREMAGQAAIALRYRSPVRNP
jgi:serine/threonine protein kinase